jgi:regulator of protease activity HflC (stomatin/prohibitin superfamily)
MALFSTKILSPETEKVVLFRHGVPLRLLPPRPRPYRFWLRKGFEAKRWLLSDPFLSSALPEFSALLEKKWLQSDLETLELEADERAIVWEKGEVVRVLGPGRHAFWKTARKLTVERFSAENILFEHKRLGAILTSPWARMFLQEVVVPTGSAALLRVEGKLEKILEPGRYALWQRSKHCEVLARDLRLQTLNIQGQELLTRDRAALRLNVDAIYRIADLRRAFDETADPAAMLYNRVQLALRDLVGAMTLDELLESRDALSRSLLEAVKPFAESAGLKVETIAARDIILPGEIKTIMNKVIEARKAAEANAIRRREETITTRSQLNTAKLIEDNPTLLRLKEIEALQEAMEKVQSLTVFDGLRGLLETLRLQAPPASPARPQERA